VSKNEQVEREVRHPNWYLTAQALREKGLLQIGPVTKGDELRNAGRYTLIRCSGKKNAPCGRTYREYWPMQTRSKCPYCEAYNNNSL